MHPRTSKELLERAKVGSFLVTDPTSIRYLTGLSMSAGIMLITPKKFILFVDSRYTEMAKGAKGDFAVRDIDRLPKYLEEQKECGFEAETVTVSRFRNWKKKFPSTKFVHTTGVVDHFRRSKDSDELRIVRRAMKMTSELLRRVPSLLRKRITEEGLARQLLLWAFDMGAEGLSFEPIVGFGTHTSSPHHHPTSRSLQKGHIVQIDVGVKYKGYCGDMSEVFFTAKPTAEQERIYSALCEAKDKAKAAVKIGATTHELDRIARDVLTRENLNQYFTHALGHGVGLDVHEGVTLSQKAPVKTLLPGEVITIEPGVYFPGKFGMRVEEMVIVE